MQVKQIQKLPPRHRNCLLHECCFWFYHCVVVCIGLVILSKIVDVQNLNQSILGSSEIRHSQETVDLWNKGYIIDIKAVNTNNCPEGYTPLLEYTWPGTFQGCNCSPTLDNYNVEYILNGICTSQLIDQGCSQIQEVMAQKLQLWKGAKLICQKRADALTFYESVEQTSSQGMAMQNCAEDQTYQVTNLPGIPCPISQTSNTTISASATKLELDSLNTRNFYYSSQNGYPIADFKVSEYQFCEFLDEINISPEKVGNYKLEEIIEQPCQGTDPRYVEFDSLNEEEFFTNNTRFYDLVTTLPGFPHPSVQYIYKLGYITYPEWSYACRISVDHNLNKATDYLLFTNQKQSIATMVGVSVPCIIIFAIFFRIFFIFRHILDTTTKIRYNALYLTEQEISYQLPNLNLRKRVCREMTIFTIETFLRIGVLSVVIVTLLIMFDSSYWAKQAFQMSCTQSYVEAILMFYEDQMDKINLILVEICFIWFALIILDMVYLVIRFKHIDLVGDHVEQISVLEDSSEDRNIFEEEKRQKVIHDKDLMGEESSQVILQKKSREIEVRDIDDFMVDDNLFTNGVTKENFFNSIENNDQNLVNIKKKKAKNIRRKKNLLKDDKK